MSEKFTIDISTVSDENVIEELLVSSVDHLRKTFNTSELVSVKLNDEVKSFPIKNVIFSLMLLPARLHPVYEITYEDLVSGDIDNINATLTRYMDESIEMLTGAVSVLELNASLGKSLELVSKYAWEIAYRKGNTFNIYDLAHQAMKNPEVKAILNFKSDESLQFKEIEESVEKQTERLVELIMDSRDNALRDILNSISIKQFQQAFVNVSLKPDLFGKIMDKSINTSFLQGMRNPEDFFINASGARKALVVNATQVRDAGYLARKLALLLITTYLEHDIDDCGTRDYLDVEVTDNDVLDFYRSRYYLDNDELNLIDNFEPDVNLIGKTLKVRSPIFCKAGENSVCKTCFGSNSENNVFHIGLSSSIVLTEQFIQRLLSSKHLLQVVADLVELPDKSELFLEVSRNSIVAKEDIELTISDFDVLDNGDLLVDRFTRHNTESDSEDEFELLFLNAVLSNKLNMDEETRVVNVKKGETVFKMNLENNELSAPLRKLLRLIEVNKEIQEFKTYSALTSAIIHLLIESGIHLNSNGVELITRALGRDKRNPHLRGRSDENTKFMRLISAITNSGSATVALAFQDYNKLLESDLFNKQQTSPLDEIF